MFVARCRIPTCTNMAVTIRHHSPWISTAPALSAPQCLSCGTVGVPALTPFITIARKTAQLIPTSRYVAGAEAQDRRGRLASGGVLTYAVPGGRICGSGVGVGLAMFQLYRKQAGALPSRCGLRRKNASVELAVQATQEKAGRAALRFLAPKRSLSSTWPTEPSHLGVCIVPLRDLNLIEAKSHHSFHRGRSFHSIMKFHNKISNFSQHFVRA